MPTKQQKAAAEPCLAEAAENLCEAKRARYYPLGMRVNMREYAAHLITKANQLLKGK